MTYLLCLVLVSGLALSTAHAGITDGLMGYWAFDEGEGTVAYDASGNGNDGTLEGDPQWVTGMINGALEFDGSDDYVEVADHETLQQWEGFTIAAWINQYESRGSGMRIIDKCTAGTSNGPHMDTYPGTVIRSCSGTSCDSTAAQHSLNEWHHVAVTYEQGAKNIYVDGLLGETAMTGSPLTGNTIPLTIGCDSNKANLFMGMIDEAAYFGRALTQDEIWVLMDGLAAPELAGDPVPEDGDMDVVRNTVLEWAPGEFAATHDVYFGTAFNDVNEADRANPNGLLVSQGQADSQYDAGILDFGQTYYWRVDEVNGAPDNTIFEGAVWSFTAEPFSIPVEAITATASSANAANMGPENTINGVGLNELDQHSTEGTDMWLSGMGDANPSIQYAFDKAYKLHEMWVWNSNQLIESFVGIGAKDVSIEYSMDGTEWTALDGAPQLAQAPGNATYAANTAVDFGGVLAQHVRITVNTGWGMLPQYGISEVRFYYIPTLAREPQPADGATTVGANVVLKWRAGREAASHQVYLGTDAQNLPLVDTSSDSSYAANGLSYDTTYYWQIVEVNEAETPSSYAAEVWRFSTPTHGTVDNFDQYDDNCNRIFFAWEDGLGHNGGEEIEGCDVPPSNGNGGGSIVGNNVAPFAERTIVAAGTQSLPFNYDNAFGPSEATLILDGQDWTASGVQSLSIMFYGTAGNSGQLYVKINNTKVAYAEDAADIARAEWQTWVIDLSQVGGNLQNVTSLTIGVDGATAAGMLYIDEIGLYPKAAEYITPVDPGNASLAGHWSFDEGAGDVAADASGNGNDGALVMAGWVPGQTGSALAFDGLASYVDIPAAAWDTIEMQATVSVWLYVDSSISQNPVTFAAYQDPANNNARVFSTHVLWGNTLYLDTGGTSAYDRISKPASASDYADAWIHWAFTKNAETGEQKIYRNGILWHSGTGLTRPMTGVTAFTLGAKPNESEFWNGSMDEFRLYNQELSQEEILWLAGRTTPVVKAF